MAKHLLSVVLIVLTAVVMQTTIRIEVLNWQAGSYLPRSDRNAEDSLSDGKWRIFPDNSHRDRLRGLVQTFGVAQYVLAPLLLALAAFGTLNSKGLWTKAVAMSAMFVAAMALWLMVYREYYPSLGY